MPTKALSLLNGDPDQTLYPPTLPLIGNLAAAREALLVPISEVAAELGLLPGELEPYGRYRAKVSLEVLKRLAGQPRGRYIDVTAVTPTPLGEGKTLITLGLDVQYLIEYTVG
jgi:formyltetrahydrofolate synthetase